MKSNYWKSIRFYVLAIIGLCFPYHLFGQKGFVENKGQIYNQIGRANKHVQYLFTNGNFRIQLTKNGFSYEFLSKAKTDSTRSEIQRIDLNFQKEAGSKKGWVGENKSEEFYNYYNQLGGFENVHSYFKVTYTNAWPGVDVVFKFDSLNQPKYDIICNVDDVPKIKFHIGTKDKFAIQKNKIEFDFFDGSLIDEISKISSYDCDDLNVKMHWKKYADTILGIELLSKLNNNQKIVIDPLPILKWATYFGGSGSDRGLGASATSDGHAIFCGITTSSSLASSGAYQTSVSGSDDAFVTKFHKNGGSSSRIWATYFGGSGSDAANAVYVDKKNNSYITGNTQSSAGISKKAQYDSTYSAKKDAYVAKFNNAGNLIWSNYVGGDENDDGLGVATDSLGNVLVVGITSSSSITTNKTGYSIHQSTKNTNEDGFLAKLDTSGNINFLTYYGGSGTDNIQGVSSINKDTIVVIGTTNSKSDISSSSSSNHTNDDDVFLAKFTPFGVRTYSRYFGDSMKDEGRSIRFFKPFVYMVGTTNSIKNISKKGFQDSLNKGSLSISSNSDAFLTKMDQNFKIIWSTYYGGDENDDGKSMVLDDFGYIYLAGSTASSNENASGTMKNIIATSDAFQTDVDGGRDAFVVKFASSGKRIWSTYFGGNKSEWGLAMSHGRFGDVYLAGYTESVKNLTYNHYQKTYGGAQDAYFADLYYCKKFALLRKDTVCFKDSFSIRFVDSFNYFRLKDSATSKRWGQKFNRYQFNWYGPNDSAKIISTKQFLKNKAIFKDTGVYKLIVLDSFGCADTAKIRINYFWKLPVDTITSSLRYCRWDTIKFAAVAGKLTNKYSYYWYNKDSTYNSSSRLSKRFPALKSKTDGKYILITKDSNNCKRRDTISIFVGPVDSIRPPIIACPGGDFKLYGYAKSLKKAKWWGPNGFKASRMDTTVTKADSTMVGTYYLAVEDSFGCKDTLTCVMGLFKLNALKLAYNNPICYGGNLLAEAYMKLGNQYFKFKWTGPDSFSSTDTVWFMSNLKFKNAGKYYLRITDANGCNIDTSITIKVNPLPSANITQNGPKCKDESLSLKVRGTGGAGKGYKYTWLLPNKNTEVDSIINRKNAQMADSGYYKLTIEDANGCKKDTFLRVTIYPKPVPKFTVNDSVFCFNQQNAFFKNNSTITSGSISYYKINYGFGKDTMIYNKNNLTRKYPSAKKYIFKAVLKSDKGCFDSVSFNINIKGSPKSVISVKDTISCLRGNKFAFDGKFSDSVIKLSRYNWDFTTNATQQFSISKGIVNVIFKDTGKFRIQLVVKDTNGCWDTSYRRITIKGHPKAVIKVNSDSMCFRGNKFIFNANGSVGVGISSGSSISRYVWDYDGGSPSKSSRIGPDTVKYSSIGQKTIKLLIRDTNGCWDTIARTIGIWPQSTPNFTITPKDTQCLKGNDFAFTNTSKVNPGSISSNKWIFSSTSNDTLRQSTVTTTNKKYLAAGNYTVKLVTWTNRGCTDTVSKSIVVKPQATLSFTVNADSQCLKGNRFNFTGSSSISSGSISSQRWDFGDGTTSIGSSVTGKRYGSDGIYEVLFITKSDFGCSDTARKMVGVWPKPSSSFSTSKDTLCLKSSFTFTNKSTVTPGSISSSKWIFSSTASDTLRQSTITSTTKTYATAGNYSVKLITWTNWGCRDTLSKNVVVMPQATLSFTVNADSQCLKGNSFNFTGSSSIASGSIASQSWNFGDSSTSTGSTKIGKSYAKKGTYEVLYITKSNFGCIDTAKRNVGVWAQPETSYTTSKDSQCLKGNSFTFNNTSTAKPGSISSSKWIFSSAAGDTLRQSTVTSTTKSFTSVGTYNIKLITWSNRGCRDTVTKSIGIWPQSVPNFTVSLKDSQCLKGNTFTFDNKSTVTSGSISSSKWIFGSTASDTIRQSTLTSTSKKYTSAGNYTVKLVTWTNQGCLDTLGKNIVIKPQVNISFTVNTDSQCLKGNSFNFTNTSTIGSGSIKSYKWDLGDGSTSAATSITGKKYIAKGTYEISLTAITDFGCKDTLIKKIGVWPQSTTNFTTSTKDSQCLKGNSFAFTNTSAVTPGSISSSKWIFSSTANDTLRQSTVTNATKKYATAGDYSVKLVTWTNRGCRDTVSKNIVVKPQATISFTVNTDSQCLKRNRFNFTGSSNISSGSIKSQTWNLGDGTTSTGSSVNGKRYGSDGTYEVLYITQSDFGCLDTATRNVGVYPQSKTDFTIAPKDSICLKSSFTFTNTSKVNTGSISSSKWNFGSTTSSDTLRQSTVTTATKKYASAGNYSVMLVTWTNKGCSDTISKKVVVKPQATVSFTVNTDSQCLKGNSFNFVGSSNLSSGSILSQSWNLGDGSTATGLSVSGKSYISKGTYEVLYITKSDFGCLDTAKRKIGVWPQPNTSYTTSKDSQCFKGNSFTFTNNSTASPGSISRSKWIFSSANGDTLRQSVLTSTTKSYTAVGTYEIKLITWSNNGCSDTLTKKVGVWPQSVPDFAIAPKDSQCLKGNSFTFNNNSKVSAGTISSNKWIFSTTANDTLRQTSVANTTKVYSTAGNYNVKLVTWTNRGCLDTQSKNVVVKPQVNIGFTLNSDSLCLKGNSFNFTNSSTIGSGSVKSYSWDLGDGSTSTITSVTGKKYATKGTYTISLIAISDFGCKDTLIKKIGVWPQSLPSFTIGTKDTLCLKNSFTFTNTSTVSPGSISNSKWVFSTTSGDTLRQSSVTTTTKKYATAGSYSVKLLTWTNKGCRDTVTKNIVVKPQAALNFTVNADSQCYKGNSFNFSGSSTISSGSISSQRWNLGDGSTYNGSTVTAKNYSSWGTYKVTFITQSDFGCLDTFTKNVGIYPQSNPDYTIAPNDSICLKNSFTFTNTSSVVKGSLSSSKWNFGSKTSSDTLRQSTVTSATKKYTSAGNYDVMLVTWTNKGCRDTITKKVVVKPQASLSFTINTDSQCLKGNSFNFTGSSSISTGSSITNQSWNLGDGSTITGSTVTGKSYTTKGTYEILYITKSDFGCLDTAKRMVGVWPQSNISYTTSKDSQCFKGNSFTFTNNSTVSPGSIKNNKWIFGTTTNDTLRQSTVTNTTKSYSAVGTYNIKLITWTDRGCKDTLTKSVGVWPQSVPNFTVSPKDSQCLKGNSFTFDNKSTVTPGNVASSKWMFSSIAGDTLRQSTVTSTTNTYLAAGNYTVKLATWTNRGCKDTQSKNVVVKPQVNIAFTVNTDSQCLKGNSFNFTSTSTIGSGSIKNFEWNLGDGNTSIASSITGKKYTTKGTYPIRLIAKSDFGCIDTLVKKIGVWPQSTPSFTTTSKDSQCLRGNSYTFTNTSTVTPGTISSNKWIFSTTANDTMRQSTVTTTTKNYATIGNYSVKLITWTNNGCKDTVIKNVKILAHPQAKLLAIGKDTQCLRGNIFRLKDTSSAVSGSKLSRYNWWLDSGAFVGRGPLSKSYNYTGVRIVRLIVKDTNGCWDTTYKKLFVLKHPTAIISQSTDSICLRGNNLNLYSTKSTLVGTGTAKYLWTIGTRASVQSANTQNVLNLKYKSTGKDTVKLILTDPNGCKDTTNKLNKVLQHPKAVIDITSNDSQCLRGNKFDFSAKNSISISSLTKNNWSFGALANPTKSSLTAPTGIVYSDSGKFNVQLIVRDSNTCEDTINSTLNVIGTPKANFITSDTGGCVGITKIKFTNNSFYKNQKLNKLSWLIDGGQKKNIDTFSYVFKSSGVFNVAQIAYNDFGCSDTFKRNIYIDTIPNVSFSIVENDTQCFKYNKFTLIDNSKTIKNQKLSKIKWDFGDGKIDSLTKNKVIHTYLDTQLYKITLMRSTYFGCSDKFTQLIKIFPSPVARIILVTPIICRNQNTAVLAASAYKGLQPYNYKWDNNAVLNSVKYSNVSPGFHFLEVEDQNKCTGIDTIYVVNPDSLQAKISILDANCFGFEDGKITISNINGGITPYVVSWTGPTKGIPNNFTAANLKAGNYTAIVTDANGCSYYKYGTVKEPAPLKLNIDTLSPIKCNGDFNGKIKFLVSGGTKNYYYNLNNLGWITDSVFINLGRSDYFAQIIDQNNCRVSDSFIFWGPEKIKINLSVEELKCYNDSIGKLSAAILGGTTPIQYTWLNSGGQVVSNQSNASSLKAGTYILKIADIQKCTAQTSVKLMNPKPFLPIVNFQDTFCNHGILNFSAIGADSSIWLRNQWLTTGNNVNKYNNISKDQGIYNYIGFDTNGCKYETSKPIFMYAAPKLFYDSLVCVNASVQFEFVPKIKDFYYTKPNNTNKLYASGSQMFIPFSKSADSGIYKFYITDLNNCYDTISANLDVKGLPKIKIIPNKSKIYCLDDFLQFDVSLNEKSNLIWRGPNMKSTNSSSLFKFGLTTQDEGTYWVSATNNFGCVDSMPYSIIVKPKPIVKFTADQAGSCGFKAKDYVDYKDFSTNVRSRLLYVDTALELNNITSANVFRNPGTYSFKLVLEDNFGCKDSSIKNITIYPKPYYFIPDAFTPNKDELNRYYKPVTSPEIEKYKMQIFDRWGNYIYGWEGYVSDKPEVGSWDGMTKMSGRGIFRNAPDGVYVVILRFKAKCESGFGENQKLTITLIR